MSDNINEELGRDVPEAESGITETELAAPEAEPDVRLKRMGSGEQLRRRRPEGEGEHRRRRPASDGEQPRRRRPEGEQPRRKRPEGEQPRRKRPEGERQQKRERPQGEQRTKKKKRPEQEAPVRSSSKSSSKKGKKKKWTKKQLTVMIAMIIFLVLCLLGLAAYLIFHYYYGLIHGEWDESTTSERMTVSIDDSTKEDTFDPLTEEERVKKQLEDIKIDLMKDSEVYNILLVGQDLRSTAEEGAQANTDVMMMLSINSKAQTITLTSFMRDMWLYIPPCNYSDRLNAAFFAGGPDYLRSTVETYFGVSIDRYVVVDFNQFIDIVDTLGGLDIYVTPNEAKGYEKDATYDPKGDNTRGMQNPLDEQNRILGNAPGTDYIDMEWGDEPDKGQVVHMNGNQALAYSRIRHVDYVDPDNPNPATYEATYSDFGRTKRQRIVISKIIEKANGASLVQLNELAHKILPNVYTDIPEGEAASLLLNVFDYVKYDVQNFRIPQEGTYSGNWIQGKSVIICNTVQNAKDLQQLIYGRSTVDEEKLREFAEQNRYYDDNGRLVDYFNNGS